MWSSDFKKMYNLLIGNILIVVDIWFTFLLFFRLCSIKYL